MKYQSLGQHILQIRGISFKPEDVIYDQLDGYVPVIKSNNIKEDGFTADRLIYIESRYIRPEQFIKKGDLVLTASSGSKKTIGKNIQFEDDYNGSFGAFCKLIRPKETINEKYLYHFFKTRYFRDTIEKAVQGANISNLKNEYIDDLNISLPPIDHQIRIAAVLTRAEKLIAKRKESIKSLDEFLKSTFLEMFGDPVRNDKCWKKLKFSEVANNENSKRIPIKQEDRDKRKGIYPYYGATGIIDTIDDYKFDGVYLLIAEDGKNLLFRRKNNAFMATGKFWVNNHAHVLSFNGICNLRYLEFFLNNIDFKPYISGIDQVKLNKESLDRISVPYPPIELQNKYAAIVEKVETMKIKYNESLVDMEKLYGSLSQRAFRGEL